MKYFYRKLFDEVKKWVDRREILAIKGPRQAGKTTLLRMLQDWLETERKVPKGAITYVTFEDRELLDSFQTDPKEFASRYVTDGRHYLLIDEAQYCDQLGQKLKLIYDAYGSLKIIITGSSSLELTAQTGRFLVGRLFEFELMPLDFHEFLLAKDAALASKFIAENGKVKRLIANGTGFSPKRNDIFVKELLAHLDEFITYGGYPEVVKAGSSEEKRMVLKGIANTYMEKDIVAYLHITDTIKFRKLLTLLAASNGSMLKAVNLSAQIGSYYKEIEMLLNVLEQTYVISMVRPYHRNLVTEIRKNPKVYFVDTGMRNYMIDDLSGLAKRPDAGALAENFVLNELRQYAKMNFWRTTAKTEVDFVASASAKMQMPIEVKFSHMDHGVIGKSMYGFIGAYKPGAGLIVTRDFWGRKSAKSARISFTPICYI